MKIEDIAKITHTANKALCETQGDFSQVSWEEAEIWQVTSAIDGVNFHLVNPNATPEDSHINWMKEKITDGWVYGEEKDSEKKTHPCMVAYNQLPVHQQTKDYLFRGIVHSLSKFVGE